MIQLKLAARRHQDFADVVNLIAVHDLDESFLGKLHPSVRGDFIECLEEKRRDHEYEARQDAAFERRIRETGGNKPGPDESSPPESPAGSRALRTRILRSDEKLRVRSTRRDSLHVP